MLTKYQKIKIDQWLNDKETIKQKRDWNKLECEKLKEMAAVEQNQLNYSMILVSIQAGKELVKKQSTLINVLSLQGIANRLNVDYATILRYERSSQKGTNYVHNRF
ncbi:MAG: hypothetical protein KAR06_03620 [Deltaproteobacteria bacterium]|nr:hypothetical protein [Deltaproteobacteria bacterium]